MKEAVIDERARRSPEAARDLVVHLIAEHAESMLRVARRFSLCADDAHDAYQRALEQLLKHADRLDADRASGWVHTVVKHEALAVNRSRVRMLGPDDVDVDAIEARTSASPEDRVLSLERAAQTAEALKRLKPHEAQAIWLKAAGHSYAEISDATGWSATKVSCQVGA